MRPHVQTQLFVWGTFLLVLAAIAAVPLSSVIGHRRAAPSLDDPNPAVRVAALRALSRDDGDVDVLIKALQDEDADVRLVAAMRLHGRGRQAGKSAKALIVLLKDKHKGVRREAIEALSAIGAAAAPALVEALADPDPHVRAGAALALSDVGTPKESRTRFPEEKAMAVPALERLLNDEDPDVRKNATRAMEDIREGLGR
jgi:HEAT repeat protein